MVNLLEETKERIQESAHTLDEIAWVGYASGKKTCSWREFARLAASVEYDNGYGTAYIHPNLVVVFDDGSWLNREEYDGSEWWEYQDPPVLIAGAERLTKADISESNLW